MAVLLGTGLSSDWSLGAKESGLYFDLGHGSEQMLSSDAKLEIRVLLARRIQYLNQELSRELELQRAYQSAVKNIKSTQLPLICMVGGACAFVGSGAFVWGINQFHNLTSIQGPASVLSFLAIASAGGMIGFSLGASAVSLFREDPQPPKYRAILDRRGDELLNAAEDLVEQLKSMALPLNFWSVRRFQDFVIRLNLLRALEKILLKDFDKIEKEMKEYIARSSYSRFLTKEAPDDLADAELQSQRSRIVQQFRFLELQALTNIEPALEEIDHPFLKIEVDGLSHEQCMSVLRHLMHGGLPELSGE